MTTLNTPRPDVVHYLHAVRATLADLPPEERDEIMVDVETALLEASEEDAGPLEERLGPAAQFAADLRAAAGLQEPQATPAREPALSRWIAAAAAHPRVQSLRRLGHDLAPIGWVVRAFVAFALVASLLGANTSVRYPWMPVVGGRAMTLFLLALVTGASVWLGLRLRREPALSERARRAVWLTNAALALVSPVLALYLSSRTSYEYAAPIETYYEQPSGLALDGRTLANVYPYTRAGRLLHDVLLYDEYGNPLPVGGQAPDPQRRTLRTERGDPIYNSFPILYFDPGTRRVAHPDRTGTPIDVPQIAPWPARVRERR